MNCNRFTDDRRQFTRCTLQDNAFLSRRLKQTPSFDATEFNSALANQIKKDLDATAKPDTPSKLAQPMKGNVSRISLVFWILKGL